MPDPIDPEHIHQIFKNRPHQKHNCICFKCGQTFNIEIDNLCRKYKEDISVMCMQVKNESDVADVMVPVVGRTVLLMLELMKYRIEMDYEKRLGDNP